MYIVFICVCFLFFFLCVSEKLERSSTTSIVSHVTWCSTEFSVALDDFVHSFQEIFLGGHLATCSNGEHASLSANGPTHSFDDARRE